MQEMRLKMKEHIQQKEEHRSPSGHTFVNVLPTPRNTEMARHGYFTSYFANVVLFMSLVVFVFVVKFLVDSIV